MKHRFAETQLADTPVIVSLDMNTRPLATAKVQTMYA